MSVHSFNPEFPPPPGDEVATVFRSSYLEPIVPPIPGQVPARPESVVDVPPNNVLSKPQSVVESPVGTKAQPVTPSVVNMPVGSRPQSVTLDVNRQPSVVNMPVGSRPPSLAAGPPMMPQQQQQQGYMNYQPPMMMDPQISGLMSANFDLQSKLERAVHRVKQLEQEQRELLDRFEKSVTIAARLKDIESERNDFKDKFSESEKYLKIANQRIQELATLVNSRSELLSAVREKYFQERERNDKQAVEIETVRTSADLAKREIDNINNRASLRELQIGTMRNLIETGMALDPRTHSNPLASQVTGVDDELRLASSPWLKTQTMTNTIEPRSVGGIQVTGWKEWQTTPQAPQVQKPFSPEVRRLIRNRCSGVLFDDRCVRVSLSTRFESDSAIIDIVTANVSPSIIQNVRVLSGTRSTSIFEFIVEPVNEPFLKPGQHVSCRAELRLMGIFNSEEVCPVVCVSYQPGGDLPKNNYLTIPVEVFSFVQPVRPETDQLLSKWREFADNEICVKLPITNEQFKAFGEVVSVVECGGLLAVQRGIDPNPRGQISAGALGKHGNIKEVVVRVELTPADHRGPPMIRLTARTPTPTMSKAIVTCLSKLFL